MKMLGTRLALAAFAVTACADSSPMSPVAGARGLAEAGIGTSQSPIDIRTERVTFVPARELPALDFRYGRNATLDVVNTGSPDEDATVRADVTAAGRTLRVGHERYRLVQFHFHTPSEHRINGRRYPMEMHLVHANDAGGLLVIGVFIRQGRDTHWPLQRIFRDLPEDESDDLRIHGFNLRRLLPDRGASIRYSGSLTTPPFSEPVMWVVLKEPIELSAAQIDAYRDLFPEGSARETQPLHGRRVVSDVGRLPDGREAD